MNLFAKTQESYSTVDCGELEQIIAQEGSNIQLIDVRTEGEHAGGHIPNSENINLMGPDFVSKLEFLDREKNILRLLCQRQSKRSDLILSASWSFLTEKKHIMFTVPAATEAEQLVARWCTWDLQTLAM